MQGPSLYMVLVMVIVMVMMMTTIMMVRLKLSVLQVQITHGASSFIDADTRDVSD